MIPLLLGALKFAPSVLSAGVNIYNAITGDGEALPEDAPAETVAAKIEALPPEQRRLAMVEVMKAKTRAQELDTARFVSMTAVEEGGDAEKIRSTARPEIALQAMSVITIFAKAIRLLFVVTVIEWLTRAVFALADKPFPVIDSIWDLLADAAPVSEMIWAPLLGSFWACVEIVKKYMGCRERDKAQQYEMQHGAPLHSAAATVEAAGGGIANIIKAVRGK
mgnify:FL=1|tara:strand:+ start:1190 stop:1852 length:663 start_codon:yes stop_codon:yes gene_type:complete